VKASLDLPKTKHVKEKICLVGDVGVGKTSLVKRYVFDTFDDKYIASVGTKVVKKCVPVKWRGNSATMDLLIWDIMGERGLRQLLKVAYFYGAQGIMAVCDVTRKDTLDDLNNWISIVGKHVGPVPFVFLGNKSDITENSVIEEEDLQFAASFNASPCYFTSAKTGENVEAAFRRLAGAVASLGVEGED